MTLVSEDIGCSATALSKKIFCPIWNAWPKDRPAGEQTDAVAVQEGTGGNRANEGCVMFTQTPERGVGTSLIGAQLRVKSIGALEPMEQDLVRPYQPVQKPPGQGTGPTHWRMSKGTL